MQQFEQWGPEAKRRTRGSDKKIMLKFKNDDNVPLLNIDTAYKKGYVLLKMLGE